MLSADIERVTDFGRSGIEGGPLLGDLAGIAGGSFLGGRTGIGTRIEGGPFLGDRTGIAGALN